MDLLVVIFSAAALLGVVLSLISFLQKFPRSERLAVAALMAVGALLLIVLALIISGSEGSRRRDSELCHAVNVNRAALRTVIAEVEATDGEAFSGELDEAARSTRGPAC